MQNLVKSKQLFAVLLLGAVVLHASDVLAGPRDLVVVRPGGPAASEDARIQVSRLIEEIGRRAGWPEGAARAYYFNRAEDALAHISSDPPGFVLTTPGFFLAHRAALRLEPVNQLLIGGAGTHRYYVVVREGTAASPEDLRGRTLAGMALSEPDFVERIVLEGRFAFGRDLTITPMRALGALRKLSRGELDAVLLDDNEHASMAGLPFAEGLATLFTSPPIPNTGLMAVGGTVADADVEALTGAVRGFCDAGEGAAICETYGISGFRPVPPGTFAALIERYGQP